MAGFGPAKDGGNRREGGSVNASRSVTFPSGSAEAGSRGEWHGIIAAAIDAAQADLLTASA